MIQNPQIAQSYILVSVLRGQRDRLLNKLNSAPFLKNKIEHMQYELKKKQIETIQDRNHRNRVIVDFSQQLSRRVEQKKALRQQATRLMGILRKNLNMIKNIRKQLIQARNEQNNTIKQQQQINSKILQIESQIKILNEQFKQKLAQRHLYCAQKQIGKARFKQANSIFNQQRYKAQQFFQANHSLQNQIKRQTHIKKQQDQKYERIQKQLYQLKLQTYQLEEDIQHKKIRIDKLTANLSIVQKQQNPLREESQASLIKIEQLQSNLERKLQVCEKINGQIEMANIQTKFIIRDHKFKQHQIQCLQMLIKRLYGCRDKFTIHRRNNTVGSSSSRTMGKLSRLSIVSSNMGASRRGNQIQSYSTESIKE